jgi:hypothetical protein
MENKKGKEIQIFITNYPFVDNSSTFFPLHKLCPFQYEKDLRNGEVLEIGFQNGQMYQITKQKLTK